MSRSSPDRMRKRLARRARYRIDKDTPEARGKRLLEALRSAYEDTGIRMDNPEHQAIALSATMAAAVTIAGGAGMRQDEFVAYAQLQFEQHLQARAR